MPVSKRLRFEILRRDNHRCKSCGRTADEVSLTVDHVVPVALGGGDEPSNLRAVCADCNSGKSSMPADAAIVDDVAEDALRWARALERVAQTRAADRTARQQRYDEFERHWNSWTFRGKWLSTGDYERLTIPLPGSWRSSVDSFLGAGLDMADLVELIDVAMDSKSRDEWKYFCGCCWKRIGKIQEQVAAMVTAADTPTVELLTTTWTMEAIGARVGRAENVAVRWLDQDSIDSAHCPHEDWSCGACGDPVCEVMRAECLGWMSDRNILDWDRQCAVMDAAEAALDG